MREGIYWEGGIGKLIEQYTKKNTIAIDIGAHIGIHTLTMAKKVGPRGKVIAFEPQWKISRELIHNLKINNIENVVVLHNALGEVSKWVQMSIPSILNEGGCPIGIGGNAEHLSTAERFHLLPTEIDGDPVYMVTLDSLHLNNVSLIKMDVESYEEFVIEGAKETILRNKPIIIFEIYGGLSFNETEETRSLFLRVINKIENLGYDVQLIFGNDYIAFPKSSP